MATIPPEKYREQKQRYPALFASLELLGASAKGAGQIDEITARLVQFAASAAIRSEGAVHCYTRRARDTGAGADEIYHTLLLLTSTIGLPGVMAAMSWTDDVLAEEY